MRWNPHTRSGGEPPRPGWRGVAHGRNHARGHTGEHIWGRGRHALGVARPPVIRRRVACIVVLVVGIIGVATTAARLAPRITIVPPARTAGRTAARGLDEESLELLLRLNPAAASVPRAESPLVGVLVHPDLLHPGRAPAREVDHSVDHGVVGQGVFPRPAARIGPLGGNRRLAGPSVRLGAMAPQAA